MTTTTARKTTARKAPAAKAPAKPKAATKAPAKRAPRQPKVAPKPVTEMDRLELIAAAKAEKVTLDAWVKAGRKGDTPATPALDLMRERASSTDARNRRGQKGPKAPRVAQPRKLTADQLVPGARFVHGDNSAVIEDDGTWTVTTPAGETKGVKSATAAAMLASGGGTKWSGVVYWKVPTV